MSEEKTVDEQIAELLEGPNGSRPALAAEVVRLRRERDELFAALDLADDNLQTEFGPQDEIDRVWKVVETALANAGSEAAKESLAWKDREDRGVTLCPVCKREIPFEEYAAHAEILENR